MKRTTLMLAAGGAVAVLATTGAALGVAASGPSAPPRIASLVADTATAGPVPSTAAPTSKRVSAEQASAIALSRAGGGRVTEVEAEVEHGRPVWKVELVAGRVEVEVYVDRETGAVVKAERHAAEVRDRHGDDNSGRDHPEDDATNADDHGGDRHGDDDGDDHGGDDDGGHHGGSGRDHPEDN
jgi:Peptidase propeptide and YPEB domain